MLITWSERNAHPVDMIDQANFCIKVVNADGKDIIIIGIKITQLTKISEPFRSNIEGLELKRTMSTLVGFEIIEF